MVHVPMALAMAPIHVALFVALSLLVPLLVLVLSSNRLCTLKDLFLLPIVVVVTLFPMPHLMPYLPHHVPTLLLVELLVL